MSDYVGKLTKNEISEIETGMLISLGLDFYLAAAKEKERAATTIPAAPEAPSEKTDIAVGGLPAATTTANTLWCVRSVTFTRSCA